ncbi:MAG TPA: hypothetical protein VG893_14475, partial [Terracidiphilus sp.]|nr:hypothetical protein [Terracidiphilus sp.]
QGRLSSVTAWGSVREAQVAKTPVFMRVLHNPSLVTMRLEGGQSQPKMPDFHSFLGFLWEFPGF